MEKCAAVMKEAEEVDIKIDALQLEARQKKPLIENVSLNIEKSFL